MHAMYKISVDMTFIQITAKRGIKSHSELTISSMYNEYTHIEYMEVMEALDLAYSKNHKKRRHCV